MANLQLWADIPGYEGYYQISTDGQIRSLPRKKKNGKRIIFTSLRILKQSLTLNGYYTVSLWKDGAQKGWHVHKLIAKTFIPNPDNKDQVNHKNGIKTDNRLENLEWLTQSENTIHAIKLGLTKPFKKKNVA